MLASRVSRLLARKAPAAVAAVVLIGIGGGAWAVARPGAEWAARIAASADVEDAEVESIRLGDSPTPGARFAVDATSVDFGYVRVGGSGATRSVRITSTGGTAVTLTGVRVEPRQTDLAVENDCAGVVPTRKTCTVRLAFAPTQSDRIAAKLVFSGAGVPTRSARVTAVGVGAADPTLSRTFVGFGQVAIGARSPLVRVVLTAGSKPVRLGRISVGNAGFPVSETCPQMLPARARCTLAIRFRPRERGLHQATLVINPAEGGSLALRLRGTGIATPPRLLPRRHDFGSVDGERKAVFAFRLAAGSARLPARIRLSNTKDYRLSNRCPASLDPRTSCKLVVTFAPTAPGPLPATLEVARSGGPDLRAKLAGRGNLVGPTLTPSSSDFGTANVAIGQGARASFTVTASSQQLVVQPQLSNRTDFALVGGCPTVLRARQSCALTVSFAPKAGGRRTATLTVPRSGAPALTAALSGTGIIVAPTLTPNAHDFGVVPVGKRSAPATFRLTAGSLPLATRAVRTSNNREFPIGDVACPQTLLPGSGCSITITFAPAVDGQRSAKLSATTTPGSLLTSNLTGRAGGGAVFGVGPNSLDFGSVRVGATSTRTVSITGHGPAPVRVSRISVTGAGDFTATNNCPATLGEGSSCRVTVRFTPVLPAGRKTGVLRIESGEGTSLDVPLTGTT